MTTEWSATPSTALEVGDAALEYACYGPTPDQSPTLVLLHEGLGCVELWRDIPARLTKATGLGVVAFSRAGYGRSTPAVLPRPLDYMTREAMDVLGPVLDALGVEKTILVGHSDGATIAAIYAGSISDHRVRGLVLLAPHFFTETGGLDAIHATLAKYRKGDLKAKLAKYHDHPDVAFHGWYDSWTNPDFAAWNVADVIDHWRIPVLAIQGREDAYGTLAQISEIDERIYSPLETVIIDDCGHAPHLETPDATCAAIADFCATLLRLEQAEVPLEPA
jgi:pimeloyl-ACP methyl ester carboxylesterase